MSREEFEGSGKKALLVINGIKHYFVATRNIHDNGLDFISTTADEHNLANKANKALVDSVCIMCSNLSRQI